MQWPMPPVGTVGCTALVLSHRTDRPGGGYGEAIAAYGDGQLDRTAWGGEGREGRGGVPAENQSTSTLKVGIKQNKTKQNVLSSSPAPIAIENAINSFSSDCFTIAYAHVVLVRPCIGSSQLEKHRN